MGKLLQCEGAPVLNSFPQQCHSAGIDPWRDHVFTALSTPSSSPNYFRRTVPNVASWEVVPGLEPQQLQALQKLVVKGVLWKHPSKSSSHVFTLHHGGDVEADGNCLLSAAQKAVPLKGENPHNARKKTVKRFLVDYEKVLLQKEAIDQAIKHLYNPDLASGWGVHVVQEVKSLARKSDREAMDTAIDAPVWCNVLRENAAEMVYKERCLSINNGDTWANYMSIAGNESDEYDIITFLASEYQREVFVVQAHGSDAMVDADHCKILHSPMFLFMKGTGWCGSGADHYEPLIAPPAPTLSQEKAALVW
ncbi:hypothetical protein KP509_05G021200 [Ceratopteris richardii]|uniref:OTU domain-containing protein n=1 Tax=Ceratopteris richardii TaxID=49495 RepID=A0A8T2UWJ3_CERRI|nr:hypothetical protein KP509_05G021000 [Ceratopteris richardii]KAH7436461.1 hypothetical protein KP509_05G021200 [Ceratopteris richardii]